MARFVVWLVLVLSTAEVFAEKYELPPKVVIPNGAYCLDTRSSNHFNGEKTLVDRSCSEGPSVHDDDDDYIDLARSTPAPQNPAHR